METVKGPYVGETVLYALENGEVAPAIVTKVHDDKKVNLRVMLDVAVVDRKEVPEYWSADWLKHTGFCPPEYACKYDPNGEGGTWRRLPQD